MNEAWFVPHICGAGHILSFCVSKVSVSPQTTKNQMKHNRIIMGYRGELSWRMKRLRQKKKGLWKKRLPDQCSSPWNWSLDGWTSFIFGTVLEKRENWLLLSTLKGIDPCNQNMADFLGRVVCWHWELCCWCETALPTTLNTWPKLKFQ